MSDRETQQDGHESREITAESPLTLPGFFSALSDGELLAGRCTECGKRFIPPRPACYECGSRDVATETQPHTGEILTYTEVYRPPPPFSHLAPFTVATVELDSGARLTGRVTAPYDEVSIGMPVELVVKQPDEISVETELRQEAEWPLHAFDPA